MCDANVEDGRAVVEEACDREVSFSPAVVKRVVLSPQLGGLRAGDMDIVSCKGWPQRTFLDLVVAATLVSLPAGSW